MRVSAIVQLRMRQVADLQQGFRGQPVACVVRAQFAHGDAAKVHGIGTVLRGSINQRSRRIRWSGGSIPVADGPELRGDALDPCGVGEGKG